MLDLKGAVLLSEFAEEAVLRTGTADYERSRNKHIQKALFESISGFPNRKPLAFIC